MTTLNNLTCIEKIIHFDTVKNQYVIRVNEKYFKSVFFAFILFGSVLGILAIVLSFFSFWGGLLMFIGLSLPLLLAGARYFYLGTLKENNIIIDLQQRVIVYSKTLVIPIKTIKHLEINRVSFREPKKVLYSLRKFDAWQINIIDHKGNKAPLVKSENKNKIQVISKDLGQRIGIPVQQA